MSHRRAALGLRDNTRRQPAWAATSDGNPWLEPDYGVIYAIGSRSPRSLIKIGHSKNLRARFLAMQADSPVILTIRAHWAGKLSEEAKLHEQLADRKRHGEWYDMAGIQVVSFLSEFLQRPPRAPVDVTTIYRPWDFAKAARRAEQGGLW